MIHPPGPRPVQQVEEQLDPLPHPVPHVRLVPGSYGCFGEGILKGPLLHVACDQRALRRLRPEAAEWSGAEVEQHHPLRYAAVIRAPYRDTTTLRLEEGVCCKACAAQGWLHRHYEGSGLALIYNTPYPIWGTPYRRYTRQGMWEHLEQYGAIVKMQGFNGDVRYVHQKPMEQYTWDEPVELSAIQSLLLRCRQKEIVVPVGQPFLPGWDHVSSERGEVVVVDPWRATTTDVLTGDMAVPRAWYT